MWERWATEADVMVWATSSRKWMVCLIKASMIGTETTDAPSGNADVICADPPCADALGSGASGAGRRREGVFCR